MAEKGFQLYPADNSRYLVSCRPGPGFTPSRKKWEQKRKQGRAAEDRSAAQAQLPVRGCLIKRGSKGPATAVSITTSLLLICGLSPR
ncbi:hypothetical protein M8818_006369 [Zalaria obscura]|uniref:Uncharacterized protein n=1 Tax=Zalaria obscura TaxID=2024903 RepID=A0ACC3S673_9PEZI